MPDKTVGELPKVKEVLNSDLFVLERNGSAKHVNGSLINGVDKINKPHTNSNGSKGQLLKSNGDGTTDWVYPSVPTDSQVDEAVSKWLSDHPEATTTVEDNSLGTEKFVPELRDEILNKETRPEHFNQQIVKIIYPRNCEELAELIGAYSIQACIYNQDTDRFVTSWASGASFASDPGLFIEFDSDWEVIRIVEAADVGHNASLTYNRNENRYYLATASDDNASIVIVDPGTLQVTGTINTGTKTHVTMIAYDEDHNCYYIRAYDPPNTPNHAWIPNIYRVSSDFQNYELLINNIDEAVKDSDTDRYAATTIYSQGNCLHKGRFHGIYWFANENTSFTRIFVLNYKNDAIDYFYDYENVYRWEEVEAIVSKNNDELYVLSSISEPGVLIRRFFLGDAKDYNEPIHRLKRWFWRSSDPDGTSLDLLADSAPIDTYYERFIHFTGGVHPELGGYNGYLRGLKTTQDYGYQEFHSPDMQAVRYLRNGTWSQWFGYFTNSSKRMVPRNGSIISRDMVEDYASAPEVTTLSDLISKQRFFRVGQTGIELGSTGVTLEGYARGIVVGNMGSGGFTGCILAVGYNARIYSAFINNSVIANAEVVRASELISRITTLETAASDLDDRVDDLETTVHDIGDYSSTTVQLANKTTPATLEKIGHIVCINSSQDFDYTTGGQTISIGTIPSGYRPKSTVRVPFSNVSGLAFIQLGSSGDISYYYPTTSAAKINGSFYATYFTS